MGRPDAFGEVHLDQFVLGEEPDGFQHPVPRPTTRALRFDQGLGGQRSQHRGDRHGHELSTHALGRAPPSSRR